MPWFVWLLAAAALGAAEFFTLTLVLGLLAGAALVAAVVAGVGVGLLGQIVALAAAAAAGLILVRPVALRHMAQQPITREGSDALIGKQAEVVREVTGTHGLVRLMRRGVVRPRPRRQPRDPGGSPGRRHGDRRCHGCRLPQGAPSVTG